MDNFYYNNDLLSKFALGTVQFGLKYGIMNKIGKPSDDAIKTIIECAIQNKINVFDTAAAYGDSEIKLGNYIKDWSNLFVISKINTDDFLTNSLTNTKKSLERLNTDNLFALLIHDSKILNIWDNSISKKIKFLKDSNLIKYFGISIYTSEEFDLAINNEDIEIIQVPFNILDLRAIKNNWFERAKNKNKLIIVRSVFLQGLLFMDSIQFEKYFPNNINYINMFEKLCNKYSLTKAELALFFVYSHVSKSIILFGSETVEQLKNNIKIFNNIKKISHQTINEIVNLFNSVPEKIYNPTKW